MASFQEYGELDGLALAELIAKGEVTRQEVLEAAIERLREVNPAINAVISTVDPASLNEEAVNKDATAPFYGVPFLLKDLGALLNGSITTFGSRLFADALADHDSEVVARYKRAGLTVIGKTNTSEMGLVATTEPHLFGATRNPWALDRSSGGSSGGAAAAVAAGIVPFAHSTDGGGSTRIPASCCGLFGLKPTRARTPIGPDAGERNGGFFTHHAITRSVRDSAALLDVAAGAAPGDPYCAPPLSRSLLSEVGAPVGKLRIAFQREPGNGAAVSAECGRAVETAAKLCIDLGHALVEVPPCYSVNALVDSALIIWSANLADAIDSRRLSGRGGTAEAVEPFTWYFAEIGRRTKGPEYVHAVNTVQLQGRRIAELFANYDVLLTPTLATEPMPLGALSTSSVKSTEDAREFFVRQFDYSPFTIAANASGNPAMSVPLAWTEAALPLGIHFLGRFGDEQTLFRLAAQLEQAMPWFGRRPPLTARETR